MAAERKQVTIAAAWAEYRKLVVPETAGAGQVAETRKAFYAGVLTVMGAVKRISEPDVSEDAGIAILEGFEREGEAFLLEVLDAGGYWKH